MSVHTNPTGQYLLFSFYDWYPGGGMIDLDRVLDNRQDVEKFLLMDFDLADSSTVPGKDVRYEWDVARRDLSSADHIQIYDTLTGVWIETEPPYGWMGLDENEEDTPEEKYLREWVSEVMEKLPNA
ncbi:hypothetical protein [Bacillus phage phiAGATE]|uniref:Uncharacterized protein n=1 Tax=Bacillus phage phiAGATE TaxID=1204533 RepID=L0L964_9CAUD|nr:hypothetical protein G380_gp028 [Bacillus phage phiAGATE]AGB62678.1 hypothetical protein [Bacillus phage phiAGATE]